MLNPLPKELNQLDRVSSMKNQTVEGNFEKELNELRLAYLQTIPDKIRLLKKAWQLLDFTVWDSEQFKNVCRLVHNLAGGAGTYGFSAISNQARAIMVMMNNENVKDEEVQLRLNKMLNLLEETAKRVVLDVEQKTHVLRKPPENHFSAVSIVGDIFIIEDDPEQSAYLSLMLNQAGYNVRIFNSLKESVSAINKNTPLAILVDMVFPESDLAGAELIKSLSDVPSAPIIFISSRTDIEARLSAVRVGARHYFTKPVDVNSLLKILNCYFKSSRLDTKKILLIDDDLALVSFYATCLGKIPGVEPIVLSEPLELLERLEEKKPDLIIMDYHMPGCNGLELSAVLRQHELYKDIPIIFLTEETNIEARLTALNIGSDDFFHKAMGPERLLVAVQARLDRIEQIRKAGVTSALSTN